MMFRVAGTGEAVSFSPRALVVAGFTGRDKAAVDAHIRELAAEGVQPPESVPAFYVMTPDLLSDATCIEASSAEESGEAEPVLLCRTDRWYVALGSDHTARDLERTDIGQSKRACPKPISSEVWPYEEVSDHWDRLLLRSWVLKDGRKVLYQEARLAELTPVPEIVEAFQREAREQTGDVAIFLGTVPLQTEGFVFSESYSVELADPVTGRNLSFSYQVSNAQLEEDEASGERDSAVRRPRRRDGTEGVNL